ncbi:hypothetical protein Bhyg_00505 [Pseudolycoriella hygida]|uniref:Uncharacterized protein n=1 Tax=Pseudolycoriella hygida TaxID=35572 RepID=A0A9Q0N9C1_9DIPT|nr:hypothetical protein Bhyg_00505 [Pseudolycoriella hygida]
MSLYKLRVDIGREHLKTIICKIYDSKSNLDDYLQRRFPQYIVSAYHYYHGKDRIYMIDETDFEAMVKAIDEKIKLIVVTLIVPPKQQP